MHFPAPICLCAIIVALIGSASAQQPPSLPLQYTATYQTYPNDGLQETTNEYFDALNNRQDLSLRGCCVPEIENSHFITRRRVDTFNADLFLTGIFFQFGSVSQRSPPVNVWQRAARLSDQCERWQLHHGQNWWPRGMERRPKCDF